MLDAQDLTVPGDLSSAAFMIAAALLVPGSRVLVRDVGVNWTRTGFLRIVERMGASIGGELEAVPAPDAPLATSEPICDLEVQAGPLRGTTVEGGEVPLAIDELPLVALLGCFAEGETIVRGAQELRVKESDRIAGVVDGLRGLGADDRGDEDGFVVTGGGGLRGGTIDALGDHRMAMLGAVAGLASREGVTVTRHGRRGGVLSGLRSGPRSAGVGTSVAAGREPPPAATPPPAAARARILRRGRARASSRIRLNSSS